jgi:YidC/Oxa1 family membrane protein insertase
MFNTILIQPITYILTLITQTVGNYGLGIVILTLFIRLILLPITLPSLKMASKMRELQPEIDQLKKKHGNDKMALQQAQLELFKTHNINPTSGCLPNIFQFIILIALYQVINGVINHHAAGSINFLWLDITKPDHLYILPIIAGVTQLVLGVMMLPAIDTSAEKTLAANTTTKTDDKQADDMTAMAQSMQQQMLFMMPVMTLFLALKFPAGLSLYWVITTIFSIGQQYIASGWGGLPRIAVKIKQRVMGTLSPTRK